MGEGRQDTLARQLRRAERWRQLEAVALVAPLMFADEKKA